MKLMVQLIDLESTYQSENLKMSSISFYCDMLRRESTFFNILNSNLYHANELQANMTNIEYRSQILKTIKYAFRYYTIDGSNEANSFSVIAIIDYCLDNVNYFHCVEVSLTGFGGYGVFTWHFSGLNKNKNLSLNRTQITFFLELANGRNGRLWSF
jgi:hypothetical protein